MEKKKVTIKRTIERANIPAQLIEDLKKIEGLPPYNGGSNICLNDNYFYDSIKRKYGETMIDAAYALVIRPLRNELNAVSQKYSR